MTYRSASHLKVVSDIESGTALLHSNIITSNKQQAPTNGACMTKTRTKAKYRVDVRLPDGRRISKVFDRKYDADKFKTEMKIEKLRFDSSGITINNLIPFKDFAEEWFQTEVKNRKSPQTQRNPVNPLILDIIRVNIMQRFHTHS